MKIYLRNFAESREKITNYLLQEEASNCLPLGIISMWQNSPQMFNNPLLITVETEETIIAVAIKTPPYNLVISQVKNQQAIHLIAEKLFTLKEKLPGVSSRAQQAQIFAQKWQELTGANYQLNMQMCIHQLEEVHPVSKAQGFLRLAKKSDRSLG